MRPRLAVLAALAAVAALAGPAPAVADPFDDVFADYQRDAKIDPCSHTPEDLQQAKRDIPNDIEQYAPEFPAALDAAMEERARTTCEGEAPPATTDDGAAAPGAAPGGTTAAPAPGAT